MRRVTRIQTRDGKLHDSLECATRHANKVYGEALTKIAGKLVAIDKYTKMADFVDSSLEEFVALLALKRDIELENPEE